MNHIFLFVMFALAPPSWFGIGSVWEADPTAGPQIRDLWSLTLFDEISRKIWKLFRELESGGKISVVLNGRGFQRLES